MLLVGALTLMGCMGTTSSAVKSSPITSKTAASSTLPPPAHPKINLRVMTFNIEYGGVGVDFASVSKAIRAAHADVVAINEATSHGWRPGSDGSTSTSGRRSCRASPY